jgi:hypothetical protein
MNASRRLAGRESFNRIANSPVHWKHSADALRDCAEVLGKLREKSVSAVLRGDTSSAASRYFWSTGQAFLMLAGFAIENLAKALLLHRGKAVVTNGKITDANLKDHGAHKLLNRAGVKLSREERDFINRMDKAVIWSGRYPVPLTARRLAAENLHVTNPADLEAFRRLFKRLASDLPGKPLRMYAFSAHKAPDGI